MADILLDTNVLSELFRPDPNERLVKWFEKQEPQSLYLSVFVLAEIRAGIERLPQSEKRRTLEKWMNNFVRPNFEGRVLSFDPSAADVWGKLSAKEQKAGRPRPTIDLMIAAIAISQSLALATRNIKDFDGLGIILINPFEG